MTSNCVFNSAWRSLSSTRPHVQEFNLKMNRVGTLNLTALGDSQTILIYLRTRGPSSRAPFFLQDGKGEFKFSIVRIASRVSERCVSKSERCPSASKFKLIKIK